MDIPIQSWYKWNMEKIENFNLFGELDDFPDVVHCETIEARSVFHDWEFAPHRHVRLHQFLLVETGGGEAIIEEGKYSLRPGDLVNIPVGVVHGFTFSPNTNGWVVTLSSELFEQSLLNAEGLRPLLKSPEIIKFGADIVLNVQSIFAEHRARSFARAHVLRALSSVLTGLVAREIAATKPQGAPVQHDLQKRFEDLLEENYLDHFSVTQYADLLGVTPTHLSRVMRLGSGQSALTVIESRVIREARRNLAFSNLRISDVAYQLGYNDPAYFSRVFKRATGLSPREFRQNLES